MDQSHQTQWSFLKQRSAPIVTSTVRLEIYKKGDLFAISGCTEVQSSSLTASELYFEVGVQPTIQR